MADKEEGQTNTPRGADWEVVSLTASAYAAAPSDNIPDFKQGEKYGLVEKDKNENALFMSGHFVLPTSQHETVPSEPKNTEILDQQIGEDNSSVSVTHLGGKPDSKEEENWNLMKLTDPDFTDNTTLSGLNLSGKEQSFYDSSALHSLHSEATIGALNINDETRVLDDCIQLPDPVLSPSNEDNNDGPGKDYASWFKKQAASLYAHAKETNTFWSIFAAAAVLSIVIIGKKWQQERWQVLRNEWKSKTHDEKMRMMAAPISRLKSVMIGGHQQDFPVRGSISPEI
ncbi:ATG8-interacting protein 2-like [Rutidosis leptorrhynchoides]|uniref:ATG8-interacting protein 2-like n=1 Tax=Rutidosis leptorrhynchoides TaxID=125765 RepID=UPI003A98DE28